MMLPTLHTDDEGWCHPCFGPTACCLLLPFDDMTLTPAHEDDRIPA